MKTFTASSRFQPLPAALKTVLALICLSSLISCQTVTVWPEGRAGAAQARLKPDYQKSERFFLWGLVGESVVPAGEVCKSKGGVPVQLQSQTTVLDSLIPWASGLAGGILAGGASFSLMDDSSDTAALLVSIGVGALGFMVAQGIYTPKTAKVWCGKGEEKAVPAAGDKKPSEAI